MGIDACGATTTLGIDPESGRIVAARPRGRGGRYGFIGDVEKAYSDFRDAGGLSLAHCEQVVRFDGEPAGRERTRFTAIPINPALDRGFFDPP